MSEIKMDYALMEEMSRVFRQGVQQLEDTTSQMNSIAATLEGGALLGRGGDAFVEAIRGPLSSAITRLREKFDELANDVDAAANDMRQADTQTKGYYG
ncbi:MAG: WXG100 family type VII secretion target [Chloroflexota bacterium]